ncbi:MAG: hypothetical protein IT385_13550 [Deltaproteobacteria bacterium]|nr:hypothetical protein [Deltaproteobacteria bacterium]
MSEGLEVRAEILKLARLVGRPAEELGWLAVVPSRDLRALREQVTEVMFASSGRRLKRLAAASKLLPVALLATIARRVFGPLLSARMAGLIDPERAAGIAARLPTSFLADVARLIDPRRAAAVIAALPAPLVASVARELALAGEHVTLGRFVGFLGRDALVACLEVIDDEAVLHTAFVLEAKERLDMLTGLVSETRLVGIIRAAARADLWPEAVDLLGHLGASRQASLAELTAAQGDEVLSSLVRSAQARGFWDALLPVTRAMSEATRRRLAGLSALHDEGLLEAVVAAAVRHALWSELLPVARWLPEPLQRRVIAAGASHQGALDDAARAALQQLARDLDAKAAAAATRAELP